jgi:MFS family permease
MMTDSIATPNSTYTPQQVAEHTPPPLLIRHAADVTQLVNGGASALSHARVVIAIALGGVFLDAYDLGALAFGMKDISRQFALTPSASGMVAASITLGAIVGALFGGYLTDKIGRYRVFMADMLFFVFAALACALAPNVWVLSSARFIMGMGVGIDLPVAMAFLAEFSRLSGRGNKASRVSMWCPTWYAAISISYLLVLLLYTVLPASHVDQLWRVILGFGAVPALLIILIRQRYMNESPVWAANQGDLPRAAEILRQSYGLQVIVDPTVVGEKTTPIRRAAWRNYMVLFQGVYLRRTILTTIISLASSFAYSAVAFGLPIILSSFFAQSMFSTILVSLALNLLFALTGGLLAVRLVPTLGARSMSIAGYSAQLVALLGLALIGKPADSGEAIIAIAMLALFLFGQGFGPGSHTMTFASLSYPTSLRGIGVGFNQIIMRSSSTLSLFLFPVLAAALSTKVFWVLSLTPLCGLLALLAIRWEPSGYDVDAEDFSS